MLLDLARRAFPDIRAAYVDTGLEYPEIREFVKSIPNVAWLKPDMPFNKVIKEYGYPVVSKEVARRIYYARKGGAWAIQQLQGKTGMAALQNLHSDISSGRTLSMRPFLFLIIAVL